MLDRWRLLLLLVLLASPVELRRASSSGGFSGRGQSSSRGQVAQGGGQFNQGGGGFNQGGQFRPQGQNPSGGFHPGGQQQPHGFQQPHNNFNRGPTNTFHPQPKTSSNTFGKALLGGAAGALGAIVVYEGAKAIIKSASEPFHYQNRAYYWDQNYKGDKSQFECRMPLSQLQQDINKEAATTAAPAPGNGTETTTASSTPPISQTIGNLQFKDGSKPRDITWGCRKDAEVCCGMECCPNPNPPNPNSTGSSHGSGPSRLASILLIIFILILVCGCCCCIVAYKMCRSAFDCILPREQKYDEQYPQNADYNQQQAQYPMQQYPQHQQQQYPQQNYPQQQPFASSQPYPNYPPQPTSYPPHPTY